MRGGATRAAWAVQACLVAAFGVAGSAEASQRAAVSPDGAHVYTSAYGGLTALARDPDTGALRFLATYPGGDGDVVVSPDGRSVYQGRHGGAFAGMGAGPRLVAYRRDQDGGLTPLAVQDGSNSAEAGERVLIDPAGARLYVTGSYVPGLRTYRRAADGSLALEGTKPLPGEREAPAMPITADGLGRLYVALADGVATFLPAGDGLQRGPTVGCSPLCMTDVLALAPDGTALFGGPELPHFWPRDPGSGGLGPGGGGPWGNGSGGEARLSARMVAGPAGRVYALARGALYQFVRRDGRLEPESSYQEGRDGWRGLRGATSLSFSPDFRHMYVAGGAADGQSAIVTAERDSATGRLSFRSILVKAQPRDLGMRINGGADYTRSRDVKLSFARVPPGLTGFDQVRVSNDGAFRDWQLLDNSQSLTHGWRLATTGPELLPKTVYAASPFGLVSRASIVLDERTPAVVAARRARSSRRRDRVRVRARDRVSGVSRIQVTTSRRKPGKWRRYSSRTRYPVRRRTVFVRVRDRAGNRSRWKRVPVVRGRRR